MIRPSKNPFAGHPLLWMAVAVFLAAASPAAAGPAVVPAPGQVMGPGVSPFFVEVKADRCARLLPQGGREVIVNNCSQCRIVNITRKRRGIAVPVSRSFNVQPKSTFQVPFRGPGRSRITSVLPCKGEKGAAINLINPGPQKKTAEVCVSLEQAKAGGIVLVNKCRACKAVLVERQNGPGGKAQRQAYKMAPQSVQAVSSKGAARVGLVGEVNCPR